MKKLIPVALILMIAAQLSAQKFEWAYFTDNNSSGGQGDNHLFLADVAVDDTGNLYLTGYLHGSFDFDPGPGTATLHSPSYQWPFVAKYDENGLYDWAFLLTSTASSEGRGIAVDHDGNIYITGESSLSIDFDPGPGETIRYAYNDPYFAKYDNSGNLIWAKMLWGGGTGIYDFAKSIATDTSGNVYVAGLFLSTYMDFDMDLNTKSDTIMRTGNEDNFIAKYDKDGNYIWAKSFRGADYGTIVDIAIDAGQNIYFAGTFSGGDIDIDPDPVTEMILTNQGSVDVFVGRLDSAGSYLWGFSLGASGYDKINDIDLDVHGNVLIAGSKGGLVDFDPGTGVSELDNTQNLYVAKYSASGDIISVLGRSGSGVLNIATDSEQNLYLGGGTFFEKYDLENQLLWGKPMLFNRYTLFVSVGSNGNLVIAGTGSGNHDFNYGTGTSNVSSLKDVVYFAQYSDCTFLKDSTATTICDNEFIQVGEKIYNEPGIYYDTILSYFGCDSIAINNLSVLPAYHEVSTAHICEGDSIMLYGSYQKEAGNYTDSLTRENGCDSILLTTLVVHVPMEYEVNTSICTGEELFLQGEMRSTDGTYYDTNYSMYECDSIIITNLTVNLSSMVTKDPQTICAGDSVALGNSYAKNAGMNYDTIPTTMGCDSIIAIELTLLPQPVVDIGPDTLQACNGETLVFDAYDPDFISYYWIDFTTDSIQKVVYSSTNPKTVQIVQVTGSNGCTAQDRVFIVDNSIFNLFQNIPVVTGPTVSLSINTMPDNADGWSWSFGDGNTLVGNTAPSHSYGVAGSYDVCLYAFNECETDSQCWTIQVAQGTAVNPLGENEFVSIYPNPTTGLLYLELHNPGKLEVGIQLMNTLGRKLDEFTSYGEKVELDFLNYPKGIYFIKVNTENSSFTYKVFYK